MRTQIHRSITEIDKNKWDAIVGKGHVICSYDYVALLEKSGINEGKCYYPVVYDGDRIAAHTVAYLTATELDIFTRGPLKKIIGGIRRRWKGFLTLKYIECGPPEDMGNPVSVWDGMKKSEALRILSQEVEALAGQLGAKLVLFRDIYDEESEFHDGFATLGYKKIHNLPKARLTVKWKNFDDYLAAMRSGYRCKILKAIKKCSGANVCVRELKDVLPRYAEDMKRLHDNTSRRAKEIKREPIPEAFFQNLEKYMAGKAAIAFVQKGSKPIGFMILLHNDRELVSSTIGIDYDHNEECCTYFNLFYKTIEYGIGLGVNEIGMGITTLEPKKDMGSGAVNLNMYMKHSNPILNKIIPVLFDMVTPPDTTGPRNVFKEK